MAKVTGSDRLIRKLKALKSKKPAAARRGLKKFAKFIFNESQKIVPTDYGPLKESGHIESGGDDDRPTESIVYDEHYAVVQHEDLEFKHKPGEQAKYLEAPLRINRHKLKDFVAKEVKK
jgi:hypothetical protein